MKNIKLWFHKAAILGIAVFLVSVIGIVRSEAATSIDDADADTSVDVEATSDEDKIHFTTFGTERMTIINTGEVGIGTASPTFALEVVGTIKADDLQIGDDTIHIHRQTNTIDFHGDDGNIETAAGYDLLIKPEGTTEATFDGNGLTLSAGASIDEFSIDILLSGDSDDAVPTEKAVRTYADTKVSNAANLTDNAVVRGDGGARGIQTSTVKVSDDGEMTNASQPAFLVEPFGDQDNLAVSSLVTVNLATEHFDVGDNFASNTFTAPVTGKYQLNFQIMLHDLDTDATDYRFRITTSNRMYQIQIDNSTLSEGTNEFHTYTMSVLVDMDAADTAFCSVYQNGGTSQTDINQGNTFFSGFLVG